MTVQVDGATLFQTNLPNLDGGYAVNEEYNLDIPVSLPSGRHSIAVSNTGVDWFYLDWVRLEQVLPATDSGGWAPFADAIGLQGSRESLLYVVAPGVSFPANAMTATLPLQIGQTITLTNWPAGHFIADWYDPATAASLGNTQADARNPFTFTSFRVSLESRAWYQIAPRPFRRWGFLARRETRLPVLVREPVDARHLELVVAEDRPGINHPVRSVIDRNHQQMDVANPFVDHDARIAHHVVWHIGMNVGGLKIPFVRSEFLVEQRVMDPKHIAVE
jgi:hypothetical protein